MKRKNRGSCYYCGGNASCTEHAPPKQMFKGFNCDCITVPSCETHNTSKSGDDQAIVSTFIRPFFNDPDFYNLEEPVIKAVKNNVSSFERTKYRSIDSPLFNDSSSAYDGIPNLAYLVPTVGITDWIRQLTAAIIWDAIKLFDKNNNWENTIVWSPDWIPSDGPATLEAEQAIEKMEELKGKEKIVDDLHWLSGWSAHPKPYPSLIYHFQISIQENNSLVFRHKFFNRYSWYVWLDASKYTYDVIILKFGA